MFTLKAKEFIPEVVIVLYGEGYVEKAELIGKGSSYRIGTLIPMTGEELGKLVAASARNKTAYTMRPGSLPKNVLSIGWSVSGLDITWEMPAGMHKLNFHENLKIPKRDFWCPRMLFRYRDESLYTYAVKGKAPITGNTKLYHVPFPNMFEEGESCMGSAQPSAQMIETLDDLIKQWTHGFMYGVFTHDTDASFAKKMTLKNYYLNHAKNSKSEEFLKPAGINFRDWTKG